jgi:hypothetical protein
MLMRKNSKNKGKVGELEASKVLTNLLGIQLRRSQQFKGTQQSADIEPVDAEWNLHPEIKRSESVLGLGTYKAIEQAVAECGDNIPFVMSRRNHKEWLVVVRADDLIAFCEEVLKIKSQHT